jgi:type IV secretory pathway TraG/TraD family ATPase VirD4
VQAGATPAPNGKHIPLALSSAAVRGGLRALYRGPEQSYLDLALHEYLKSAVFGGDRLRDIYKLPFVFGFASLLLQLPFSIAKDIRRRKQMKYGRLLKGPLMLTPKEFNETVQGDGIGFKTTEAKEMMRIPLQAEAQHIELMGDTGAGKTTLIMQILRQIQGRGHSAIVYDPACEFIQRFFDAKRGDIVLNPLDARCPYWGPSEELRRKAEAKAIAASLYQPTSDKKGEFFTETPQKIFAHLLTFGPTPGQLVAWLYNPNEIDQRVRGTEMEAMIAKGAQQQRNGVLASLGLVADSLRMLPTKAQAKTTWSATEWSEKREGWIFITSSATEREALRPLHSLWIDLLVTASSLQPPSISQS